MDKGTPIWVRWDIADLFLGEKLNYMILQSMDISAEHIFSKPDSSPLSLGGNNEKPLAGSSLLIRTDLKFIRKGSREIKLKENG
jgi:hypothetical protein